MFIFFFFRFNPLSTGHARQTAGTAKSGCSGFNPLSTGHALGCDVEIALPFMGFNPLSTGHAPDIAIGFLQMEKVSIPYLRVTHGRHY